jgi:hypothetical protein
MTLLTFLIALTTALIGFVTGRAYVYRELRQTLNIEKKQAISDTPIGDQLAAELNIIISKMDAGERV